MGTQKKSGDFMIVGERIKPGQRVRIDFPLTKLSTHTPVTIPIHIIHGTKPGPRLLVCAAIHGDEVNGVEIIRQLLKLKYMEHLAGTLIAVPVVNVFGFITYSRYLPDRRDLNRCFPGSASGSLTAQLAHFFMEEIIRHCTHGIDIHTAAIHRSNFPQVRVELSDATMASMALAFGAPIILDGPPRPGTIRMSARERYRLPFLLYEAGEALRFDEFSIRTGVKGIVRVMASLGMINQPRPYKLRADPVIGSSSWWLRAPSSGILRTRSKLGDYVIEGQPIGIIADPLGDEEIRVVAHHEGVIIGCSNLPMVHQGDALFHIAEVSDGGAASQALETFKNEHQKEISKPLNRLYP